VPADVFRALSGAMRSRLAQWDRGRGFAALRADWLDRAAGVGRPIRVRLVDRETTGRFEALDTDGRLMLRHVDGSAEIIAAGDVFPLLAHADAAAAR
jgi:BirA family biotin operon repressor/biotin-[acetyl-CoA-carboxylase] ligase